MLVGRQKSYDEGKGETWLSVRPNNICHSVNIVNKTDIENTTMCFPKNIEELNKLNGTVAPDGSTIIIAKPLKPKDDGSGEVSLWHLLIILIGLGDDKPPVPVIPVPEVTNEGPEPEEDEDEDDEDENPSPSVPTFPTGSGPTQRRQSSLSTQKQHTTSQIGDIK